MDGKNQGSSSEAVNCYYGAYLWTSVRHSITIDNDQNYDKYDKYGEKWVDKTRMLLDMEIRGGKTYWRMHLPVTVDGRNNRNSSISNSKSITQSIYNPAFAQHYMAEMLG